MPIGFPWITWLSWNQPLILRGRGIMTGPTRGMCPSLTGAWGYWDWQGWNWRRVAPQRRGQNNQDSPQKGFGYICSLRCSRKFSFLWAYLGANVPSGGPPCAFTLSCNLLFLVVRYGLWQRLPRSTRFISLFSWARAAPNSTASLTVSLLLSIDAVTEFQSKVCDWKWYVLFLSLTHKTSHPPCSSPYCQPDANGHGGLKSHIEIVEWQDGRSVVDSCSEASHLLIRSPTLDFTWERNVILVLEPLEISEFVVAASVPQPAERLSSLFRHRLHHSCFPNSFRGDTGSKSLIWILALLLPSSMTSGRSPNFFEV